MSFFRGETVTIIRTVLGPQDSLGGPLRTESRTTIRNVLVEFNTTTTSKNVIEQAISTDINLYFPRGTIIKDQDQFIVRNTRWEKNGIAENPSANTQNSFLSPGVVVAIKQVKG